jgi:hypothetical protein
VRHDPPLQYPVGAGLKQPRRGAPGALGGARGGRAAFVSDGRIVTVARLGSGLAHPRVAPGPEACTMEAEFARRGARRYAWISSRLFFNITRENWRTSTVASSAAPAHGRGSKRQWLAERLQEGLCSAWYERERHAYRIAPLESAGGPWRANTLPVLLWVTGSIKEKVCRALMEYCLADAKAQGVPAEWHAGAPSRWLAIRPLSQKVRFYGGGHKRTDTAVRSP